MESVPLLRLMAVVLLRLVVGVEMESVLLPRLMAVDADRSS